MTTYDFDKVIDRNNTGSVKWGLLHDVFGSSDLHPMWVADMDFPPPAEVTNAIRNRLEHEIFGYTFVPASVGKAIQAWVKTRHNWEIRQAWITYSSGVVPTISTAVRAFTSVGDKVMLQSPVYTPFFSMVEKNERVVVNSPLKNVNNRYEIDFEDFEAKLKEGVKLFILCNPHNPSGRVWKKEELLQIGELCKKYNCLILSDEIHSDLVFEGNTHVPIARLEDFADFVMTCIAPSKTFNLAGLQASAVITSNQNLRELFQAEQQKQGFHTLNTFGIVGMEAAYLHGETWLKEALAYMAENIRYVQEFLEAELPQIKMMQPEGTYLIWMDCRGLGLSDDDLKKALIEKGKLGLEPGPKYGAGGEGFVRMNVACSKEHVTEGLERLKAAFV
ncbi:pyridoxal phosphate-dependent aminotransferase [Robertmurraya korlensis]|uniref:MalY/PatB family protein n=1 Tax=Robertmurraya korlensis TaxID=519977 RepID=UPI00203CE22F|nr:MalY/PatB family protein [Robertmurraya korlensis]MCM3600569.1 pyridoxal phosphate-dependent aminotransferase [Robertmurraya korlensis]